VVGDIPNRDLTVNTVSTRNVLGNIFYYRAILMVEDSRKLDDILYLQHIQY